MLVTLIGRNSLNKVILPQTPIGDYWIKDSNNKEKKLVNIEGKEGKWQINSNNYFKIINNKYIDILDDDIRISREGLTQGIVDRVTLREYGFYCICLNTSKEIFILYCSPVCEKNFSHVNVKNINEILIGSAKENHISFNNALVSKTHTRLMFTNGAWVLENFDKNFGAFINNKPVLEQTTPLKNGDCIFIIGLKIIIVGKSLFVNNPLNTVKFSKELEIIEDKFNPIFDDEIDENEVVELYSEKEYYSRAPRLTNVIETEKVKIDPPPEAPQKEEMPMILVLGSTLSMGVVMIFSSFQSISGLINKTATLSESITSIITALVMLLGMLLIPILNVKYEKKQKVKYEERRQRRYKRYIDSKVETIEKIMRKQRSILFENHLSTEECANLIMSRNPRLWERKIEDHDFLSVRLGKGNQPLKIEVEYPEEQFSMDDDNLMEITRIIGDKSKTLEDSPIAISLAEKNICAIVSQEEEKAKKFVQNLLIQLVALQSYEDLKIVFLLKDNQGKYWDYLKMLPHMWDNFKQIRFFGDNINDIKEISKYLEIEIQNRIEYSSEIDEINYKAFSPYYLIVTDDYKYVEEIKIISEILKQKKNLGFSILCMTNNLVQLPNECKNFVILEENSGKVLESEMKLDKQVEFNFDTNTNINTIFYSEQLFKKLSNIPIKYSAKAKAMLPKSITFLEMYNIGRIEQLNVVERWTKNDSTMSLAAPIGIDMSKSLISLDIHEKFHGPHGLIAGSTGSGKSEFIITYILSLAINYHPDDIAFVLIDYKGGGLAGAFKKKDVVLPHLVGTITNIDKVGLQRSLDSIQSELRRRQIKFNEARNLTNESTIDIYKYQKLYHEGIVHEPIPHLLIICDEFAELKQQQEEFMDELISVARIGRSLGVHLILATQKPAGIVDDQIRSNSKFGICLKVQDKEDSNDVIKRPDAAYLKSAGQFYMNVGNNEEFVLGQSGWAGATYIPADSVKTEVDNSIEFISNIGYVVKKMEDYKPKTEQSEGDQLTSIVRYLSDVAKQKDVKPKQLWLENIPEDIYLNDEIEKYNFTITKNVINPVIGEYDDPYNQKQGLANLNLSKNGNTIIFGNAESGKETLVSTAIYDIITTHSPEEVNLYILDFGSEALKIFKSAPQVGDVVFFGEEEKIKRLLNMIQKELKNRKEVLSEFGGDYELYLKTQKDKPMPMITVIMNNYEAFSENYLEKYEDLFQMLTREGVKYGITFILTASSYNEIRYRLAQNFKQQIALQLNNDDDYFNIFEKVGKKRPSHSFGRGLIEIDEGIYEFQTARICEADKWNNRINEAIDNIKKKYTVKAKCIPTVPDIVSLEDVSEEIIDLASLPIGIENNSLNISKYNFRDKFLTFIAARNVQDAAIFASNLLKEIKNLSDVEVTLIDTERILQLQKTETTNAIKKFTEIEEEKLKTDKHQLFIIIGIDKFISELEDTEDELERRLDIAEEMQNYSFIFAENANKLKNHEYDEWYKKHVDTDNGIWIGNGIEDQYVINVNASENNVSNNCGMSFGYKIQQSEPTLIKLLGIKGEKK